MRLWHKDLIPVLPKTQLKQLFRDCVKLLNVMQESGNVTPNDIRDSSSYSTLRVNEYSISHLYTYTQEVYSEIKKRGYTLLVEEAMMEQLKETYSVSHEWLFYNWHTDRYLKQCYMFLDEMLCCEKISPGDFDKIESLVSGLIFM